jgi:hydrogenase maturation protein HypF
VRYNAVVDDARQRVRIRIFGAVQGVGFRPFVFRLAESLALAGWVQNTRQGVIVEVEGEAGAVAAFERRLVDEKPAPAAIYSLEPTRLDPAGYAGFAIRDSDDDGAATALMLPDITLCDACRAELFSPADRRFRYPFINCTHCGPRYSIVTALPYDRPHTTMRGFAMCPACEAEYHDPADRRFHAQPIACPACGPQLALWDTAGISLATRDDALWAAADALRAGRIVALKGLGGFQLLVDARDPVAVGRLRVRKAREEKPFAVMAPSLTAARSLCVVSDDEARLLAGPAAPIVLLRNRGGMADNLAPGNPTLGVMLPYTPLHALLLDALGFPVVATSGNRAEEPICIDEREALDRLAGIADLFLVHDRPIARHVDDSIARIVAGRELLLRRARGYAPLPVAAPAPLPPILAVGAHLKNTVALAVGPHAIMSQHIGDLASAPAAAAFARVIDDLQACYGAAPAVVACDAHPDYHSTQYARATGLPMVPVQHHLAHVLACVHEHGLTGPLLGVAWDGSGYGLDGTVWGGEFFVIDDDTVRRVAHLRPFPLPGGEAAVREPRRSALGLLHAWGGAAVLLADVFTPDERTALTAMLDRDLNCPRTSSVGRLFDAVASLLGLRHVNRFEGQAAMALEFSAVPVAAGYPLPLVDGVLDWAPLLEALTADLAAGTDAGTCAGRFQRGLAEAIVRVAAACGHARVVLAGGCFLNRSVLEQSLDLLRQAGHIPCWPQRVPPNDGAIALGQLHAAAHPRQWR